MSDEQNLSLEVPFIATEAGAPGLPTDTLAVARMTLEAVIESPDFLPQWFARVASVRGEAVCKVKASGTDYKGRSNGRWAGTGFLVSPNVLLTNHHVLNSSEVARNASAIFGYEHDEHGNARETVGYRLNPDRLFVTSPVKSDGDLGLDFTFVWVEGRPGDTWGYIPMSRGGFEFRDGKPVNIIQHPNGEPKQICIRNSVVKGSRDFVLRYTTDTMVGTSGAPVCDDNWQLVALHHAANGADQVNEGILLSAIATFLEQVVPTSSPFAASAQEVLHLFEGSDAAAGFFGTLGRHVEAGRQGLERVVDAYQGEDDDLDVGFWNIEWFNRSVDTKLDPVARIITSMNLDIWAFEETSPASVERLVKHLKEKYYVDFGVAHCEPDAPDSKQSCSVIWNKKSAEHIEFHWPEEIHPWFDVDSRNFGDLQLEAVHGKVFNRYPRPFRFRTRRQEGKPDLDFCLIPVHLKAMDEGSLRRQQASKILAAAIDFVVKRGDDADWMVGGDFNAKLATRDFQALQQRGMTALSAEDEEAGAFSYVKKPKSLIDHIFVTGDLTQQFGATDFFIVAHDRKVADYVKKVSDHRPVVCRLSLSGAEPEAAEAQLPETLKEALAALNLAP